MFHLHNNTVKRFIKLAPAFVGLMALPTPAMALSTKTTPLFEVAGFPITNSMVTGWVLSVIFVIVIRLMVGKATLVPSGGQMVVESLLTGIRGMIAPIVGKHMVKPTFPLLVCMFTFILLHNWSGLFPFVGSIGFTDAHGHFQSHIRPVNADLNMTLALALIHFGAWVYFVLRYAGPKLLLFDIFGNKADKKTTSPFMYMSLSVVFLVVGLIEVVSITFRNVSLPFRLFGNVFGGENLLHSMMTLLPWYIPIGVPFYFLELLIGFVQAMVFTLLVAVYIGLICNHDTEEHAH